MSGIEKTHRLTLAIDRVVRHGDYYLNSKIASTEMDRAIKALSIAVENIKNWEEIVDHASDSWVDLTDELVSEDPKTPPFELNSD